MALMIVGRFGRVELRFGSLLSSILVLSSNVLSCLAFLRIFQLALGSVKHCSVQILHLLMHSLWTLPDRATSVSPQPDTLRGSWVSEDHDNT